MRRHPLINSKGRISGRNANVARMIERTSYPRARMMAAEGWAAFLWIGGALFVALLLALLGHSYIAGAVLICAIYDMFKHLRHS